MSERTPRFRRTRSRSQRDELDRRVATANCIVGAISLLVSAGMLATTTQGPVQGLGRFGATGRTVAGVLLATLSLAAVVQLAAGVWVIRSRRRHMRHRWAAIRLGLAASAITALPGFLLIYFAASNLDQLGTPWAGRILGGFVVSVALALLLFATAAGNLRVMRGFVAERSGQR